MPGELVEQEVTVEIIRFEGGSARMRARGALARGRHERASGTGGRAHERDGERRRGLRVARGGPESPGGPPERDIAAAIRSNVAARPQNSN